MISSGIFVLPGIAFSRAGPAVIVAYGVAGLIALLGTLSVLELTTGMPKAGGDYFFITRSLGPLVGTVSGLLSWFALSAKSAFAVFGLASLLSALLGLPLVPAALTLAAIFIAINLLGARSAAIVEVVLVAGLLSILVVFVALGLPEIEALRYRPFIKGNWNAMASGVGFVFVSFGGLINATSIAGEVRRPARSLPVGFLGAIIVVTVLYVLCLVVAIGILPADELGSSTFPLAEAAGALAGRWGFAVLAIAGALAFITTVHAGILSASRYPFALSRDLLLPDFLGRMTRRSVPLASLLLTGTLVAAASIVKIEILVAAASTIILCSYLLANVAAMVMRYSRLTSYRPTFRVPLTPVVQIISIVLFVFFIVDLGAAGLAVAAGLVVVSFGVYLLYGRKRHTGEYALLHLIERITNRELTGDNLERELRTIVHEKNEVVHDPVDEVLKEAAVLDLPDTRSLRELFPRLADVLSGRLETAPREIERLLWKREQESSTAISEFVAVPHLVVKRPGLFTLVCARLPSGVRFSETFSNVKAVFVLAGSSDRRTLHLQTLAALAQIAMDRSFETEWLAARKAEQLREVLLLGERRRLAPG
jgi:APA family basic amino acid/polyamine antiporter